MHWDRSKNGVDIKTIAEIQGKFEIHDKENKLIFPRPELTDAGNYTCSIPALKQSAEIRVFGKLIRLSKWSTSNDDFPVNSERFLEEDAEEPNGCRGREIGSDLQGIRKQPENHMGSR